MHNRIILELGICEYLFFISNIILRTSINDVKTKTNKSEQTIKGVGAYDHNAMDISISVC